MTLPQNLHAILLVSGRKMNPRDDNDHSESSAPLLSSNHTVHRNSHDLNITDASVDLEQGYSGSWFVWVLTFSAAISGLLFGYEYVDIYSNIAPF